MRMYTTIAIVGVVVVGILTILMGRKIWFRKVEPGPGPDIPKDAQQHTERALAIQQK